MLRHCAASSGWLRTPDARQLVQLTLASVCPQDGSIQESYLPLTADVIASEWTELRARFTVDACSNLTLFVEGPRPGVEIHVDDFCLRPLDP